MTVNEAAVLPSTQQTEGIKQYYKNKIEVRVRERERERGRERMRRRLLREGSHGRIMGGFYSRTTTAAATTTNKQHQQQKTLSSEESYIIVFSSYHPFVSLIPNKLTNQTKPNQTKPNHTNKKELENTISSRTQNLRRLEAQRNQLNAKVRLLRDELRLLHEPGSYVGEVVKVMGKNKVLVKANPDGKYVVDINPSIDIAELTPTVRVALRYDNYQLHKVCLVFFFSFGLYFCICIVGKVNKGGTSFIIVFSY